MTTAREWDFTVPDGDAELLAELRRHGVRAGQRLHVAVAGQLAVDTGTEPPAFFGSFSGSPDLAERAGDILKAEFPHPL